MPEELEGEVDELFERLEELLGPFAIPLAPDEHGVEYELDEWPPADRQALAQALIESEVPHRWEGSTVVVVPDAEATVDELLGRSSRARWCSPAGSPGAARRRTPLSTLFTSADRLAPRSG